MSENLDLVRSIYADWERGGFGRVDWAHPDIEWIDVDGPDAGSATWLAPMEANWREWLRGWDDFRAEAEGIRELDGERVLALHRFTGRGKTSGVEVGPTGPKGACLFYVVDDKVR